jgi:hypothetical protein
LNCFGQPFETRLLSVDLLFFGPEISPAFRFFGEELLRSDVASNAFLWKSEY